MKKNTIDKGNLFDFGRTSKDYAQFRDIYPQEFYTKLIENHLFVTGQNVLDIGTGTGVLPRNLFSYGARFTGIDIAEEQIIEAKRLAKEAGQQITFQHMPAEELNFPSETFDIVSACQCFIYFHHECLEPKICKILKKDGRLAVLYMAWLPYEDEIAGKSEQLILKYNPNWTGCHEQRHPIQIPDIYWNDFILEKEEVFDLKVPFTRESWNGRIKTCRGVEASLSSQEIEAFDKEHRSLLENYPKTFMIQHYAAICVLKKK